MLDLLASALILAQAVGPGYVPPPTSFYVCLNDRRSYLNLRSAPTTRSRSIGKLSYGESLVVLDRFVSNDGLYWAKIRTSRGVGYVRDDYVCIR
jgi:hypothetical protein